MTAITIWEEWNKSYTLSSNREEIYKKLGVTLQLKKGLKKIFNKNTMQREFWIQKEICEINQGKNGNKLHSLCFISCTYSRDCWCVELRVEKGGDRLSSGVSRYHSCLLHTIYISFINKNHHHNCAPSRKYFSLFMCIVNYAHEWILWVEMRVI